MNSFVKKVQFDMQNDKKIDAVFIDDLKPLTDCQWNQVLYPWSDWIMYGCFDERCFANTFPDFYNSIPIYNHISVEWNFVMKNTSTIRDMIEMLINNSSCGYFEGLKRDFEYHPMIQNKNNLPIFEVRWGT